MKKYNLGLLMMVPFARYLPGGKCECGYCKKKSSFFIPGLHKPSQLLLELGAVGGNPKAFQCAWCGATDRERHLWMYMESTGILEEIKGAKILHFAPEKRLSKGIAKLDPKEYIFADLFPDRKDVRKVDLLNTGFETNSFDGLIANHVLEHVEDDKQALLEIFRILKPGGFAILQTPYSAKLHKTFSDPGVETDLARFIAYGQEDHVRLYGQDIFSFFEESGLISEMRTHQEELGSSPPEKFGVNGQEPFFLFRKPQT